MRSILFKAATAAALFVTCGTQAAQAAQAQQCLTRPEVNGMVAYFLPSLLDTTIKTCSAQAADHSFLRTRAPQLVGELNGGRDAAWPMARAAFMKFAGDDGGEIGKMSDAVVKPFIEEAINGMVAQKITTRNCSDVDRVLTPLAPLPAANVVDLLTELLMVAARGDKKMPTCG
jgi:hypothetical protein